VSYIEKNSFKKIQREEKKGKGRGREKEREREIPDNLIYIICHRRKNIYKYI